MLELIAAAALHVASTAQGVAEPVRVGFNYPATGPRAAIGLDQRRAAELALEEINAAGGVLGRPVELIVRDSRSKPDVSTANAEAMIDAGAAMIFGGSSSDVALAVSGVAQARGVPFFGTLTGSDAITAESGNRHTFRAGHDDRSGARVVARVVARVAAELVNREFAGRKFVYVTADHDRGHSTEGVFRRFTDTEDTDAHGRTLTPFPGATDEDLRRAITRARTMKPDVLVLVLFGHDVERAIRHATASGLKSECRIVVPHLTLTMAEAAGPEVMEGVIGALPWTWRVPYELGSERGIEFVEAFAARHERYPSTAGASAYTILHQWKEAVERAGSFDAPAVITALEGHRFTLLKDEQEWRDFDHQNVQTVFAVRCRPAAEVTRDRFGLDYFEIVAAMNGDEAFRTREEWTAARAAAGLPPYLDPLPGETAVAGVPVD